MRFVVTQGWSNTINGSFEEAKRRWGRGRQKYKEVQSLVPGAKEAEVSNKINPLK